MGNCDYGSSGGELFERLLNLLFRFGIERGRRLVEQQNRRIFQNCACNREPLLLSAGKKAAFVSDDCFVAFRLRQDEIVGVSGARRFINFLGRSVEPAELNIFKNGVVK